jgi:hypothetical protein
VRIRRNISAVKNTVHDSAHNEMRHKYAVRVSILFLTSLTILSCAVPARHADEYTDQQQVQIVSAHRFNFRERGDKESGIRNQCTGRATEELLSLLEEVVLRGPRTARTHSLYPPGTGGSRGISVRAGTWIRCRFDNGQNVDVRLLPGFGQVEGEGKFWVILPEELMEAWRTPSAWDTSYATQEPGPEIAVNEWISRNFSLEDITLDNSPVVGKDGRVLELVSAKRYSTQDCWCPLDREGHQCDSVFVGEANAEMVLRLGHALYYPRGVMLKFFPDGSRSLPSWMEDAPSERIHCIMDNGREVIIEYRAKPEVWCVQGEEGLRLERWTNDAFRKLLGSKGWEPAGE